MGLRSWWRRFTNRIKQVAARFFSSDSFMSEAFFDDGSHAVWQGKPSGSSYAQYQYLCQYVPRRPSSAGAGFRQLTHEPRNAIWVRNTFNGGRETFQ
jgi:hypothetical protein